MRRRSLAAPPLQSGVALVTALMIVLLVVTITIAMRWRFELDMSRSGNRWHGAQAQAYLVGAEQLAILALKEDQDDPDAQQADHRGEVWAQQSEPFPTDHGWVSGVLEDAEGRLNINSMMPRTRCPGDSQPLPSGGCPLAQSPCDRYSPAQEIFVRLLQTLNLGDEEEPVYLPLEQAEAITEAVIDWLDGDSEIRGFGGAESDYYEQLNPPVSIANGEMVSVSELQVVKDMPPELYRALLPYVIALPQDITRINVNTAPANVLRTLTDKDSCTLLPLDAAVGSELYSLIEAGEFTAMDQLEADPALPGDWLNSDQQLAFDTSVAGMGQSTYFLFFGETAVGDHIRRGRSLIKRESASGNQQGGETTIRVVRRTDANF